MEGRGRSRARKQRWFSPKRLTSFLLAAAMVCTNIGSDLSTAYAAGASTDVTFEMRGADLTAAVEEAIASENVVAPDDLNFTNGNVDDFNGYLFGEGKLYEAYPEMEGGDVETNMRVFVRVPEDADDMYAMTGDEEVIFLYINNSEDTVQFRSRITYTVNGEEKVKQTDRITVRSYESVYGDEEVNVISEPVNTEDTAENAADTTAPSEPAAETPETDAPETEAPAEDPVATESEMTASISKNEAALVAAPAEKATPSELPEEEETTEAETEESAAEEETGEEPETEAPEEEVPETVAPETEAPETAAPAEDPKATASEMDEATKSEIESVPKPSYSDLVGIGWSGTAKLYSSTLNKLHAMDTSIVLTTEVEGADGVTVTLSARDGVVPEGSYIEAVVIDDSHTLDLMMEAADEKLNSEEKKAVDIFAADITLYDADGNEIQPDGSVKVSFEGTDLDEDESTVFHMENRESGIALMSVNAVEENNYVAKKMATASTDDGIAFTTTHFSEYAIVEAVEGKFYPVSFFYMDGDQKVVISEGQYVEEGQAAEAPEAPNREGYTFDRWSVDFSNVTSELDVEAIYIENVGTITLRINYVYNSKDGPTASAPWIAEVLAGSEYEAIVPSPELDGYIPDRESVTFDGPYMEDQTKYVVYTGTEVDYTVNHIQLGVDGVSQEIVDTEKLTGISGSLTNAEAKEYVGFHVQEIPNVTIQSNGQTVVNVVYARNTYEISFNTTEGASYVETQRAVYGAPIVTPENPTKQGYTFVGWFPELPETMPAQNMQVTAQWRGNTEAPYQIIYWLENLDGSGYDYVTSVNGNGRVGDEITARDLTGGQWEDANIDPDGVARDTSKDSEEIIAADGSAVKNVYYNRKTFNISFYTSSWSWDEFRYIWEENQKLRINAKYGQDISEQWEDRASQYEWNTEPNGNTSYTLFANMPAYNTKVYAAQAGTGTTITYYIEGLDGNREVYAEFEAVSGVSLTEEDQQPIDGFTFYNWKDTTGWNDNELWLYYTRNSYTISFENCEGVEDANVKFEQVLKNAQPNGSIGRPNDVYADSKFGGWYYSPACEEGTEVDWNADRMPSHNLQVYAKWIDPEYTVTFHTNGGNDIQPQVYSVGAQINNLPEPTKSGDTFRGWYTDENLTYEFVEKTNIFENIDLYAKWSSDEIVDYTVKHVDKTTGEEIAEQDTGTAKLGDTTVIHAKDNLDGYYADITSMTVLVNVADQIFTIEYTPIETWTYTVEYRLAGTEQLVPGTSIETSAPTDAQEVVVSYKAIDGYTLASAPSVTVRKDDESRTAIFYYTESKTLYHVQHMVENLNSTDATNPDNYQVYDITTVDDVESGIQVSGESISITGFTYDGSIQPEEGSGTTNAQNILTLKLYYTRNSYTVKYEYTGKVPTDASALPEDATYKYGAAVEVAADATADGYTFSGWDHEDFTMPAEYVMIRGSFTPNTDISYTVEYETAEGEKLLQDKVVENQTMATTVTEEAAEIAGYTVDEETKSLKLAAEGNVITFIYTPNTNTPYTVEWYYEDYFGNYPASPSEWETREGTTDTLASVSEWDMTPEAGYAFDADNESNVLEGNIHGDGSLVLKLYFDRQYYEYTVIEHFEGNRDVKSFEVEHKGSAIFGDSILERSGVQVLQNMEKDGHTYTLIGVEGTYGDDGLVTSDPALNHVDIYYALDEIGGGEDPDKPDDVPDKYQLVFTYVPADPTTGNVTGKTVEVKTFTDEAGNYIDVQPTSPVTMDGHGPVPEGNSGYAFAYWTVQGGDENVRDYTKDMSHTLGQATYIEDTVFEATFLEDKGGTEDPDTPDGKPDIYQIKFTYVTEDPQRGTFNGVNEVSEVLNRPTNDDGSTNMDAGVKPTVGVTITENGRYRFDHWTDPAGTEYTTEELQNAAFTTDTTFTAHFRYVSGGGHDGGSSGSGGGGNPYNPSTGGPGEVLIDEGNVPLAPLPTEGTGTTIYDGDVPLAPLPKTGQQSSKTPVMMLLTGLFMAFAALTRRKEEKQ